MYWVKVFAVAVPLGVIAPCVAGSFLAALATDIGVWPWLVFLGCAVVGATVGLFLARIICDPTPTEERNVR